MRLSGWGRWRWALATGLVLAVSVGVAVANWSDTSRSHMGAPPGPRASAESAQEQAEQHCSPAGPLDCHRDGRGHLVVLLRGSQHTKPGERPVVLIDVGGPGADVLGVLTALPEWSKTVDLMAVPEPWTYSTRETGLSASEYRGAIASSETAYGRLDGAIGFSFGAVRLLALMQENGSQPPPMLLASPAPIPGESGADWSADRQAAAYRTVRSIAGNQDGKNLDALVSGERGVPADAASLAMISLAVDARGNTPFLRKLLSSKTTVSVTQRSVLLTAARQITLAGQVDSRAREAYFADICRTYPDWRGARAAFGRVHQRECAQRRPVQSTSSGPLRVPAVDLWVNPQDPVVSSRAQHRWRGLLGKRVAMHIYSEAQHGLPLPRDVRAFLETLR